MEIYMVTAQRVDHDGWPLGRELVYFVGTDLHTARRVYKQVKMEWPGANYKVELSYYEDNVGPEVYKRDDGSFWLRSVQRRLWV